MDVRTVERFGCGQQPSLCLGCHSHVLGNGPHQGTQFSGHGDHDLIGIFAFGHQVAIPFAEPDLAFQLMAWIAAGSFARRRWR